MQIDWSDEHTSNAKSPSVASFELSSNTKLMRFVQCLKHGGEIVSIDEGIQIWLRSHVRDGNSKAELRIDNRISQPLAQIEPLGNSRWLGSR
jgi:hypothetical protein